MAQKTRERQVTMSCIKRKLYGIKRSLWWRLQIFETKEQAPCKR